MLLRFLKAYTLGYVLSTVIMVLISAALLYFFWLVAAPKDESSVVNGVITNRTYFPETPIIIPILALYYFNLFLLWPLSICIFFIYFSAKIRLVHIKPLFKIILPLGLITFFKFVFDTANLIVARIVSPQTPLPLSYTSPLNVLLIVIFIYVFLFPIFGAFFFKLKYF